MRYHTKRLFIFQKDRAVAEAAAAPRVGGPPAPPAPGIVSLHLPFCVALVVDRNLNLINSRVMDMSNVITFYIF